MTTQQPQSSIKPPSDWDVHHSRGLLRYDDTPKGNLVLLADVVRWLMQSRVLPPDEAVELVCAALEGKRPPLLYHVNKTGWAKPDNDLYPLFLFVRDGNSIPRESAIKIMREVLAKFTPPLSPERDIAKVHALYLRLAWFDLALENRPPC